MFVLDFERGQHVKERLRRSGYNAMVPISIEVDGQSVTGFISSEHADVFIGPFWAACLSNLEAYETGRKIDIPIDLASIFIESDGETVEFYSYIPSARDVPERYSDRFSTSLQEYVAEAITTAEEFVEYYQKVRPEDSEGSVEKIQNLAADAREWYEQRYGEPI